MFYLFCRGFMFYLFCRGFMFYLFCRGFMFCFVGGSCLIYGICIYLRILVSNMISIFHDVWVVNSNTTGVTNGAGTAYSPRVHPRFVVVRVCLLNLSFLCTDSVSWIIVCNFVLFDIGHCILCHSLYYGIW